MREACASSCACSASMASELLCPAGPTGPAGPIWPAGPRLPLFFHFSDFSPWWHFFPRTKRMVPLPGPFFA
jgi:hypothetical protein